MSLYDITRDFEQSICEYTGAPFCVTFDSQSSAMFSALTYENIRGKTVGCPKHTYMSVPCMIIAAGGNIRWIDNDPLLTGAYPIEGTKVWDSALRFTCDMYIKGAMMCLSFTGPYKHLKLGKAGAVLTDNKKAYEWLKRFRYNGRNEVSYHEDNFTMIGYNFYLLPELAARGLRDMSQFYYKGEPKENKDITLPYPDLSVFECYNR